MAAPVRASRLAGGSPQNELHLVGKTTPSRTFWPTGTEQGSREGEDPGSPEIFMERGVVIYKI